jgi:hypothetical protein
MSPGRLGPEILRYRGPAEIIKDRSILSSERMLRKDYESKCSVDKVLVVGLKGLIAKTTVWR